ncbi:MAG: 16S rRNA (cytidine(1402)-2'-O)-methyltransferase [Deltaproteobacteria bacterium]|nr:16S rRNA (cytidine(1402)-2'-O)-methyltransferase [Deltaproteobacteria bacterium]
MGILYVVATPIGNLEDITLRALRILKEVDLIAAEDTRHTKKLLSHYAVSTPLTSYFEHNEKEKAPLLVGKLKEGSDIALVSDAGTPGISDPGYRLVRLAIENSIPVVPVPGPSALISVLSASGLPLNEFTFKGFVPSGASRKKVFLEMKGEEHTYVFYESPNRLKETLDDILEVLGDIDIIIAREMTKMHEEILRGRAGVIAGLLKDREIKGEIVIVLRTVKEERGDFRTELKGFLDAGLKLNDAVKAVSQEFGLPKSEVYKEALRIKDAVKK